MAAKPDKMPEAVVEAIKRFATRHNMNVVDMLSPSFLKWDGMMGCYYFMRGNVFHGVELDGHIHT